MADLEKVIKGLGCCTSDVDCRSCVYWDKEMGLECPVNEDALELLQQFRWSPVSERLPEDGSNVLAYYDNKIEQRMFACVYEDGEWFYRMLYTTTVFKYITHWMPLPEPPQKGGGGE